MSVHNLLRQSREKKAVAQLTRELDALEMCDVHMLGAYSRIEPYTVRHAHAATQLDMIIYHGESKAWFGTSYMDAALVQSATMIRPNDVVFDFGCNSGLHTTWFGMHAKNVHAFDPFPWNPIATRAQAALNGLKNVTTHSYGVGNRDAHLVVDLASARTFNPDAARPDQSIMIEVQNVARLRELHPTFLKIDIEGAEHELAHSELLSFPSVRCGYVEMHPDFILAAGADPRDFIRSLVANGFSVTIGQEPVDPEVPVVATAYYFERLGS